MKLIRFHRHGAIKGRSSRAIISTELITLAYLQKKREKERKKEDGPTEIRHIMGVHRHETITIQ